jgi:general secretion pathway protein F
MTANFSYRATGQDGKSSRGEIEAESREQAVDKLLRRGLTPLKLQEAGAKGRRRPSLNSEEKLAFARDLAGLTAAGIALEPALGLIAEQMERASAVNLVSDIRNRIRSGSSLSQAMAAHSEVFTAEFVGLAAAGERSGALSVALRHLETLTEDRIKFRQRLIGALIYPTLLALLTLVAVSVLTFYVLPQFESLFADNRTKLPASTAAVLATGRFLGEYGPFLLAILAAGTTVFIQLIRRPTAKAKFDLILLTRTGLVGRLLRDAQLALYSRALAALLAGGVPLAAALDTAGHCLSNAALANAAADLRRKVQGGSSLSAAAALSPLLPRRLVRLLALAEQTASLSQALLDLAALMERERGQTLDRALSLLTPVLTLVLGTIIGTIFASLISGLMSLNDVAM